MSLVATEFVHLDAAACEPFRRRGGCVACAEGCPVAAIEAMGDVPTVSETCVGCGSCAVACPVGAIEAKGFGEAADPSPRHGRVVVECARVPPNSIEVGTIRVPCLNGLTASHLLALRLAAGEASIVLMDRDWCGECSVGKGEAIPAAQALVQTRNIMLAIGLAEALVPRLRRSPLNPALRDDSAARGGVSRRGLFRRFGAVGSGTPSRTPVPVTLVEAAPVVRNHLRQVALLRRLSEMHGGLSPDRLLPSLGVSEVCHNSGACAAHCPTQALQSWVGEAAEGLSFDPRSCIGCGLCVQSCPEKALSFNRSAGQAIRAERAILTAHSIGLCRQCGSQISDIDADGLCSRCRNGIGMLRSLFPFQTSDLKERECHEHT